MLTMFRDPWFPCVVAFYLMGVFTNQMRFICVKHRENCSAKIKITAVSLAGVAVAFTLIVMLFKKKFYKVIANG